MKILLGYELGTGKAVEIPLTHLAVTGQTQASGKTTTLEALISRSGLRAVAFVTKRGEGSFTTGRSIPPYFRERADWQFVKSLLESQAHSRMNFEAAWIIRACKGARTLADVQRAVRDTMGNTKRALDQNVCEVLNAYFDVVLPQIAVLPYTKKIDLAPGINVMNLTGYSMQLQALVIRSVLEWVYEREENTIVIIPEAWEFIPQKRGSPVMDAAIALSRKGGSLRNYVWLDSQDMAGVNKEMLRAPGVWILGVQREINEVKRTLAHIPIQSPKPQPADVMKLGKGEFFVCFESELRKVYVCPAWLPQVDAQRVAAGEVPKNFAFSVAPMSSGAPQINERDEIMWREKYQDLEAKYKELEAAHDALALEVKRLKSSPVRKQIPSRGSAPGEGLMAPSPGAASNGAADLPAIYDYVKRRAAEDPGVLVLLRENPELRVKIERPKIDVDGKTLRGALALLISEGFFDSPRKGQQAFDELVRRGRKISKPNVYRECDGLAEIGFLTNEDTGYKAVAGMKVNIA